MATLASSESLPAPARPRRLAAPVWTWSASQAEAQVWQAGTPAPEPAAPPPDEAAPATMPLPTLLVYDYLASPLGTGPWARGACQSAASQAHPHTSNAPLGAGELLVSSPAWHVHLLRLLFQLVLKPELAGYPAPSLAAHTQLPVAAVRQVLSSLAEQGFWNEASAPGASPLRLPAPAHYWLTHYAGTLRRRLNAQRYRPRHPATLASWSQRDLPAGCLWGGATAAHRLLGHAELPASATVYSQLPRPQLVQQLDLLPAPKGPIELLNAFAPADFCASTAAACVPPLLAYADLLASQKAEEEALAHELRTCYLAELLG